MLVIAEDCTYVFLEGDFMQENQFIITMQQNLKIIIKNGATREN